MRVNSCGSMADWLSWSDVVFACIVEFVNTRLPYNASSSSVLRISSQQVRQKTVQDLLLTFAFDALRSGYWSSAKALGREPFAPVSFRAVALHCGGCKVYQLQNALELQWMTFGSTQWDVWSHNKRRKWLLIGCWLRGTLHNSSGDLALLPRPYKNLGPCCENLHTTSQLSTKQLLVHEQVSASPFPAVYPESIV